jgi:hypothetical protein
MSLIYLPRHKEALQGGVPDFRRDDFLTSRVGSHRRAYVPEHATYRQEPSSKAPSKDWGRRPPWHRRAYTGTFIFRHQRFKLVGEAPRRQAVETSYA